VQTQNKTQHFEYKYADRQISRFTYISSHQLQENI